MLWEQNIIEERQNTRMLVDKIWFLMSEMNRGPGYHAYHRTLFTPKKDQEGWTNGRFPHIKLKLCHKGVLLQNLKGPPIRRSTVFQILIELATTGPNLWLSPFFPVPVNKISWSLFGLTLSASITLHETVDWGSTQLWRALSWNDQ